MLFEKETKSKIHPIDFDLFSKNIDILKMISKSQFINKSP